MFFVLVCQMYASLEPSYSSFKVSLWGAGEEEEIFSVLNVTAAGQAEVSRLLARASICTLDVANLGSG